MIKSPFKFLDSYTKDDREIFFGRDREIEELYHRVFESKLMLVYGVSGTGKSSLIQCGLANKFQETDWLPMMIRRGGNIIENLAASIKTASITKPEGSITTPVNFKEAVRSLYLDHYKPVFFIFDQFEELFIFGNKDEKRSFIQVIKLLVDSDIQCRFIFVMREEYMANITEFEKSVPTIFSNRVRIEKMSHINALEAIKGPCKIANIDIEQGFAEALLEKLSPESADVELTYLQVFLDRILRLAPTISPPSGGAGGVENNNNEGLQKVSFTISLLSQVGNVSDLLGGFLDEQISLLDNPEAGMTILKSFVSIRGTKQPMKPEEVIESSMTLGRTIEESVLLEMIRTFIHLRILCEKDQNGRYELRHDALAAKIFEKFTLAEKELLEVRKYVENAWFTFESRGLLLNKDDLDYLKGYENKLILPQYLNEFINNSRQKLLLNKRALTRVTRISGLIFVLLLATILRYYFQNQQNTKTKDLFGLALVQSETNPLKGLNTMLELWKNDSTSSLLHYMILKNLQNLVSLKSDTSSQLFLLQNYLKPVETMSVILNAKMSISGNHIFGWLENQNAFILNIKSNKIQYIPFNGDPCDMKISEDDSLFTLVFKNGTGFTSDFNGIKKFSFEVTLNDVINKKLTCFFPKGIYELAAAKGNKVLVFDRSGKIVSELKGHTGRINAVDISPDGKFIVTASSDNKAFVWNYNYKIDQLSIYDSLVSHKDKIWSCRFNKTGKYIITASADSTIRIWNLNGKQINPTFKWGVGRNIGDHYKYNKGEKDEDASNPEFSQYYTTFCDAEFSSDEKEIIATGYTTYRDTTNINRLKYRKVMFFDAASSFPRGPGAIFFSNDNRYDTITSIAFREIIISPKTDLIAGADELSMDIDIFTGDGRKLTNLRGDFPMFSRDGGQIFWIRENKILRMLISPGEIGNQLNSFKISGRSKEFENIKIGY